MIIFVFINVQKDVLLTSHNYLCDLIRGLWGASGPILKFLNPLGSHWSEFSNLPKSLARVKTTETKKRDGLST